MNKQSWVGRECEHTGDSVVGFEWSNHKHAYMYVLTNEYIFTTHHSNSVALSLPDNSVLIVCKITAPQYLHGWALLLSSDVITCILIMVCSINWVHYGMLTAECLLMCAIYFQPPSGDWNLKYSYLGSTPVLDILHLVPSYCHHLPNTCHMPTSNQDWYMHICTYPH